QVFIDGVPASAISAAGDSILVAAPASLANETSFNLVVRRGGVSSEARTVPIAPSNPALFTVGNNGTRQTLAINENGLANSPQYPAQKGHLLRLFVTGLGVIDDSGRPVAGITADVNGIAANVEAVARADGYPSGYYAVDISVPQGAPAGD